VEILDIISTALEIGLPAILLWQLWQVWERLNAVTDKLIALSQEFDDYREQTEAYRAEVQQEMRIQNATRK
jgi:hypothetical protein